MTSNRLSSTDDLFAALSADLQPTVSWHSSIGVGVLGFVWVSVINILFWVQWYGMQQNLIFLIRDPWFVTEMALAFATLILAAYTTFTLATPGYNSRPLYRLNVVAVACWAGLLLSHLIWLKLTDQPIVFEQENGSQCAIGILLYGLGPAALLSYFARRRVVLFPRLTGSAVALAATACAAIGVRLCCATSAPLHVFLWHYLPVFLTIQVGAYLGPRFFATPEQRPVTTPRRS